MKQTTFKDKLGRPLAVGDRVAVAAYKNAGITIGRISKFGTVRVYVYSDSTLDTVAPWLAAGWTETFQPNDVIKV